MVQAKVWANRDIPDPLVVWQGFMQLPILPSGHGVKVRRIVLWAVGGHPCGFLEVNFPAIPNPNFSGGRKE